MPCFLEYHITKQRGEQIGESCHGILAKDFHQHIGEVVQFQSTALFMHHQTLELEYLWVVDVYLGSGRDIVGFAWVGIRLVVRYPYDAQLIHFPKNAVNEDAVAESEEAASGVPAQLADAFRSVSLGIEIFLHSVELVNLRQPNIVANRANLLLEVVERAHLRFPQLHHTTYVLRVPQSEKACAVAFVLNMEQRFHVELLYRYLTH